MWRLPTLQLILAFPFKTAPEDIASGGFVSKILQESQSSYTPTTFQKVCKTKQTVLDSYDKLIKCFFSHLERHSNPDNQPAGKHTLMRRNVKQLANLRYNHLTVQSTAIKIAGCDTTHTWGLSDSPTAYEALSQQKQPCTQTHKAQLGNRESTKLNPYF